jgi:hypothetical protein
MGRFELMGSKNIIIAPIPVIIISAQDLNIRRW